MSATSPAPAAYPLFHAKTIRLAAWAIALVPASLHLLDLAMGGAAAYRGAIAGCLTVAGALALGTLRAGRPERAALIVIWTLIAAAAAFSALRGGVFDSTIFLLFVVLVISGWLLGRRAMIPVGLACLAVLGGLALLQNSGQLPALPMLPVSRHALSIATIMTLFTLLTYFAVRDREQREERLRASETRFRQVFDNAAEAMWIVAVRADGRLEYEMINRSLEAMTGLDPAGVAGKTPGEAHRGRNDVYVERRWRECLAFAAPLQYEETLDLPTGTHHWHTSLVPVRDQEGRIHRILGIAHDITERKQAEAALAGALRSQTAIFEASPHGIATFEDRKIVMASPAHERMFGYAPGELRGKPARLLYSSDEEYEQVGSEVYGALCAGQGSRALEAQMVRKDGTRFWCRITSAAINHDEPLKGTVAIFEDISERRRAEEALRASRRLLEQVIDAIPMSIFAKDRDSRYIMVNQHFVDFFESSKEALLTRHTSDLPTGAATRDQSARDDQWVFRQRKPLMHETLIERPGGARVEFHSSKIPLFDDAGELTGLLGINREITEDKRAAQTLRESEARFAAMFHDSPAPLALVTIDDRRFRDINQAFIDLFGFTRERVIGHTSAEFGAVASRDGRSPLYDKLQRDGQIDRYELTSLTAGGNDCLTLVSGRIMKLGGERFVLWNFADITELRRVQSEIAQLNASLEAKVEDRTAALKAALEHLKSSQEALLQSEKLAALGRLVAGVAHELNTPIGNSLLSASTLAEHTEAFAAQVAAGLRRSELERFVASSREASAIVLRNLEKAAGLIRSFKQLSADQTSSQRRSFELRELVDEVLLTHRPMLRKSAIELRADVPAGIRLDSYPGPLGQVLGNLLSNALLHGYDASEQGAVLVSARADGAELVEIAVIDGGHGIAEEDLKRIFDPFFTTKLGRGGTGLGLSISHSIVTEMLGGSIHLASQRGEGTRAIVRIPLAAPVSATEEAA